MVAIRCEARQPGVTSPLKLRRGHPKGLLIHIAATGSEVEEVAVVVRLLPNEFPSCTNLQPRDEGGGGKG